MNLSNIIINPLLLHFLQTYRTLVHLLSMIDEICCICMYFHDQWVNLLAEIESIHSLIVN